MQKAQKKSLGVAFLIWLLAGGAGFHRLYVGDSKGFIGMITLAFFSLVTSIFLIGFVGFFILGLWWFLDFFLLGRMVKNYNNGVEEEYKNFWEMIKNR